MCHVLYGTIKFILSNNGTTKHEGIVAGMMMLILPMMSALTWTTMKDNMTISHVSPPTTFTIATKLSEHAEELLNTLHQPVSPRAAGTLATVVQLGDFHAPKDNHLPFATFYPIIVSLRLELRGFAEDFHFSV